ncbi:MAG: hypothetical protein EOP86_02020 [Verrucomicrobiaceae bacterium]|nr:MAG: hypothetical protein EOP86_02020 [Verrucomicrobiaceae bacterium]
MPFSFAWSDYFVFFGAVSLLLGILGYVRAKSFPSLIAGGISGIGLMASAVVAAKQALSNPGGTNAGYVMALVLSILLLGRFLPAFLKTKKFYPAGIMALLSVLGVAAAIAGLMAK